MTQQELVLAYVKEHNTILPAKMAGKIYMGQMFGSETSKRCRELRKKGKLQSYQEGKFTVYKLPDSKEKVREEMMAKYPELYGLTKHSI